VQNAAPFLLLVKLAVGSDPLRQLGRPFVSPASSVVGSFRSAQNRLNQTGSYPRVFWDTALILANKSIYTAFAVKPSVYGHAKVPWRVYAVIVQQAVPGTRA
jgi:hypothetical protein